MAEHPGVELQRAIRERVVAMLGQLRDELDTLGSLAALGDGGPEWVGTALDGHVLAPLDALDLGPTFSGAVLRLLGQLTGGMPGGVLVALHGWQAAPGTPRGIALAGRIDDGAGRFAFAVHVLASADGPQLGLTASGRSDQAVSAVIGSGWSITASGDVAAALQLLVALDGSVDVVAGADGDNVRVELARAGDDRPLGVPDGPSITLGRSAIGGAVTLSGAQLDRSAWVRLPDASAQLLPSALAGLVSGLGPLPLDVDIGFDGDAGMTLGGSGELRASIPVGASVPGLQLDSVEVSVRAGGALAAGVELAFGVRAAARVTIPGAPVGIRFVGLGMDAPFVLGDAPVRGFDVARIASVRPNGAGVEVDLPVVRAGGFVAELTPGEYSGALAAAIPPMTVSAFGVLATDPFSFIVILGATFPPPGIQVGFGFAVSGIGGVVGINRRVDRDALLRAVVDGTAAALLFPRDPASAAGAVGGSLPALFPASRGGVVAGPMFQMSWGGRLVTASVAVLIEVAPKPRFTVIGKLVIGLPDPAVPLVLIQVTFAGQFEVTEPSVILVASMQGSHVAGIPITGDVCLVSRGGPDATFALSAGGFHPAFPLPRGIPAMSRIGMDLSPAPLVQLRAEGYFAVTSNTVQFGARVELVAEVAGCGIHGHLGFDVLLQLEPFRFVAEISIGVAVTVVGEDLVGIGLDLTLEGPAKWRARGRGSIDLFLFSVSFDFDEEWGSAPSLPRPAPDVGGELAKALAAPGAWVVHRSSRGLPGVVLTADADRRLGLGELVEPYGSLTVRQRRVPLGITIDRFDRIPLPAKQTWDVVDGLLGTQPSPSEGEVREPFAAAQFLTLTDDQQLARPAYEQYRAGIDLVDAGVVPDEMTPHTIEYETKLDADPIREPEPIDLLIAFGALALDVFAAAPDLQDPMWWPPPSDTIIVAPETPLTLATSWSMTEVPEAAGRTAAELFDAIGGSGQALMVVEAWETS